MAVGRAVPGPEPAALNQTPANARVARLVADVPGHGRASRLARSQRSGSHSDRALLAGRRRCSPRRLRAGEAPGAALRLWYDPATDITLLTYLNRVGTSLALFIRDARRCCLSYHFIPSVPELIERVPLIVSVPDE